MEAWIIYDKEAAIVNEAYISWFIDEANQQGVKMSLVLREDIKIGIYQNRPTIFRGKTELTPPPIAVVRTVDPLLSAHLEKLGVHVFNSAEISQIANHKGLSHYEVQKLGIPMLDTFYYTSNVLKSSAPCPFPFVVKNVRGRGGTEVFFIASEEDWKQAKFKFSHEVIIQSTNVQPGKDIRVFVIGKEIVAAVLRENDQDFRANYTLGGSASLYELNAEEKKIINKLCTHFDFDLIGIDFLIDESGNLLFNEIEDIVGSRTLSALTDINLLQKYTTHIINKVRIE